MMSSTPPNRTIPASIRKPSVSSTHSTTPVQNTSSRSDDNSKSNSDSCDEKMSEKGSKEAEAQDATDAKQGQSLTQSGDDFPDGGLRAWLVLFGAMCSAFATFGYVNSWAVFQEYYQETLLKDQSPSNIAWIGSIQYSLIFLPSLFFGRLFDLGYYRSFFAPCSILLVVATILVGQCTQYWHFLLCQGLVLGIACGGIFGPVGPIIAHWFKKKRGLALGYMAVGSSLGGTTLPIALRNLILTVGFQWTMRITGFILLVVLSFANLTMKRRLPPVNVKGGLFNFAAFKSIPYTIYCISGLIILLGLYTVLTYINVSATQLGSSPDLAFYFISFANASSLFGRWTAGLLADRLGPTNVMIPFTLLAGVLTCVWPSAHTTASLIVVTVIYGFCSGVYVTLLTHPVMELGGEGDVGRRIGMFVSIAAFGALAGPPISGAINHRTGGFEFVGLYAGLTVAVGVVCMIVVRQLTLKRWIGRM